MKIHGFIQTIIFTSAIILFISGLHIIFNGTDEDALRSLISSSAMISAIFFALAFSASGLHNIFKNNIFRTLIKYRPHLGLIFGVSHSFHLGFLIWLQYAIHPVFTLAKTSSLIGGGLAYVFMYLMVLTTFPQIRSKIHPKNWKRLHTIGGYWIWFIFIKTYLRKVTVQNEAHFLLLLLFIVLMVRLLQYFSKHKKKNSSIIKA